MKNLYIDEIPENNLKRLGVKMKKILKIIFIIFYYGLVTKIFLMYYREMIVEELDKSFYLIFLIYFIVLIFPLEVLFIVRNIDKK